MSHGFQVWLGGERDLSPDEQLWVDRILGVEFAGRNTLVEQMRQAKVIGYCSCGCRSVNISVPRDLAPFEGTDRVPVELEAFAGESPPIVMYLHVVDGYVNELEVYRVDSSPLNEPVQLETMKVIVQARPTR